MRLARLICFSSESRASRDRAWPIDSIPSSTMVCTSAGSFNKRMELVIEVRSLPPGEDLETLAFAAHDDGLDQAVGADGLRQLVNLLVVEQAAGLRRARLDLV